MSNIKNNNKKAVSKNEDKQYTMPSMMAERLR